MFLIMLSNTLSSIVSFSSLALNKIDLLRLGNVTGFIRLVQGVDFLGLGEGIDTGILDL